MTRRPDGALETDVLRALWELGEPASPGDVIAQMDTDLAYTSIATVLGRLCDKQLASRERRGRAYVYRAASTESELTATRLTALLDAASDRESALAGFVRALDADDAARLAVLLGEKL